MAKYAIFLSIPRRTLDRYGKEEIERAALILWHAHPPEECEQIGEETELFWTDDFMSESGMKGLRVMGDFTEPEEKELANAKDEG
jgi:hypothetical protein